MTKMLPLIEPRVNLNGTSRTELVQQYLDVAQALYVVIQKMGTATPHGRDYQTFEDGAIRTVTARAAWSERRGMLETLRREIEAMAVSINDQ